MADGAEGEGEKSVRKILFLQVGATWRNQVQVVVRRPQGHRGGSQKSRELPTDPLPPLGCWTGKTGKDPHKHWSECMFWTGNVPVRSGKAPVRADVEVVLPNFFCRSALDGCNDFAHVPRRKEPSVGGTADVYFPGTACCRR